jgi:hypothetical protein
MNYEVLELQNNASIIITQYGGRIFGPFFSSQSESILWVSELFADTHSLNDSIRSGEWNLGGERIWIAPEISYNVRDRDNFWGSYHLPAEIDPGHYVIERPRADRCRLSQDMTLKGYGTYSGVKELHLERHIFKADDPLRSLKNYGELLEGVEYAGFEQLRALTETNTSDIYSETWDLLQLNSGGTLLISTLPHVEHTDYYQPTDNKYQRIYKNHARLRITGDRKYKVGYKSAYVVGRAAYINTLYDGRICMIIRSFFNNPSAYYAEEPFGIPGCHGHSLHVYNDDGSFGSFGELECNGQTIGGRTGKSSSNDTMSLWIYIGGKEKLQNILYQLLGIRI